MIKKYCVLFICCFLLSACQYAGTIFTTTQKVTALLLDDRSFSDDVTDTKLNVQIRNALTHADVKFSLDIEITVFEGIVLLNGALPSDDLIDKVLQVVWRIKGVKNVYNYIRLDTPLSIEKVNEDALVSAKIRYQLAITRGVSSSNYKITMENGTIYLMGIHQNIDELEKVVAVIKNTYNISDIVILTRRI